MLHNFDNFVLSSVFKVTIGTKSVISVITKVAAVPVLDNIQFSCHFKESSTLQLINGISNDLQKLNILMV